MYAKETTIVTLYAFDQQGVACGDFQYKWVAGTGLAANSTITPPLQESEGFACVWDGESWGLKEDHRGKSIYSTTDKSLKEVEVVGEIEDGYTLLAPLEFDSWSGAEWVDLRTEEEKLAYKRAQYPSLTRYQFLRCLLENGYKPSDIEAQILTIEDELSRELTLLGFKEATNFVRTDESILLMQSVLNLTSERIDEMWEHALTL